MKLADLTSETYTNHKLCVEKKRKGEDKIDLIKEGGREREIEREREKGGGGWGREEKERGGRLTSCSSSLKLADSTSKMYKL